MNTLNYIVSVLFFILLPLTFVFGLWFANTHPNSATYKVGKYYISIFHFWGNRFCLRPIVYNFE